MRLSNAQAIHDIFLEGVADFNQQRYFECHEHFEMLWMQCDNEQERHYLQGILQIAVALHHRQNQNGIGFSNLLAKGLLHLNTLQATHWQSAQGPWELPQVDIDHLLADLAILQSVAGGWPFLILVPPSLPSSPG